MFRFTLLNHLCRDMEQVQDTSRPPDRIRQDVSRSPGGDSRIFLNNCIGCHSGMDPMAQAFAYYNFDRDAGPPRLHGRAGAAEVPASTPTTSSRATSRRTTTGTTAGARARTRVLGWPARAAGSGTGAKSLGEELANSDAFAQCQVEKVFRNVCFRVARATPTDRSEVDAASSASSRTTATA